jgi:hypothetical protein
MPPPFSVPSKPYLEALVRNDIRFEWSTSRDAIAPKTAIMHILAEQIYDLGQDFFGSYQILIGPPINGLVIQGVTWLVFDEKQHGLGFSFGKVLEGNQTFPARRYSLRPLTMSISTAELYFQLTGVAPKLLVAKPAPALKLVTPVDTPTHVPTTDVLAAVAKALKKVNGLKDTLAALEVEEAALDAELSELEAKAAQVRDVDALVEARARQLMQS